MFTYKLITITPLKLLQKPIQISPKPNTNLSPLHPLKLSKTPYKPPPGKVLVNLLGVFAIPCEALEFDLAIDDEDLV